MSVPRTVFHAVRVILRTRLPWIRRSAGNGPSWRVHPTASVGVKYVEFATRNGSERRPGLGNPWAIPSPDGGIVSEHDRTDPEVSALLDTVEAHNAYGRRYWCNNRKVVISPNSALRRRSRFPIHVRAAGCGTAEQGLCVSTAASRSVKLRFGSSATYDAPPKLHAAPWSDVGDRVLEAPRTFPTRGIPRHRSSS
jgi:hypothetical protein